MALDRYNPLSFSNSFFDAPRTFFPRDLTTRDPNYQYMRHPGYDVQEDEKNYMVSVDVPGVRPEDMNIEVEENSLRVSGGRKVTRDNEVSESKFDYRLPMGDNVDMDNITANLDSGVLQLVAPKTNPKPKSRKIQITNGPAQHQVDVEKKA